MQDKVGDTVIEYPFLQITVADGPLSVFTFMTIAFATEKVLHPVTKYSKTGS